MATRQCLTIEDLDLGNMPDRWELIDGRVVERQWSTAWPSFIGARIATELLRAEKLTGTGYAFMAEAGFVLDRERTTLLAPSAAYVRRDRFDDITANDFVPVSPDIAVQVLTPFERLSFLIYKTGLYLEAGSTLVWLVFPDQRAVTVFTQDDPPVTLVGDAVLDGGDVLPEFRMTLAEIFER